MSVAFVGELDLPPASWLPHRDFHFSDLTELTARPGHTCLITAAYKDAEGMKLLGKRLLIDVERGRTVKGWKPRRLGGGLGGRPKKIVPRKQQQQR